MPPIDALVAMLRNNLITTWIADESDPARRLKAMVIREIYNIGRDAAVVFTNGDGVLLDGWYNGLPESDTVLRRAQELCT